MNWIKINFCTDNDCKNEIHRLIDSKRVCDLETMPKRWDNFLVSDGFIVEISECHLSFHNWDERHDRKIKNKNILYWMDLNEIPLP